MAQTTTPETASVNSVQADSRESVTPIADKLPDFADYLPESLQPYWQMVETYPVIAAPAIALIFFAIAYLVRAVILRSVQQLCRRTSTNLDDIVVEMLSRPIFNTVVIFGLTLAARAIGMPESIETVTVNLLVSIIVVIWMMTAFRMSGIVFRALASVRNRFRIIEERTTPLLSLVSKLAALLVGSYILLMIWGINPAGWLASAGIVGIAVGFAARDTLANLFSGFFILVDSPYKIGDYINLDSGERGQVTHLGMRSTRLITRDDIEITVPNAVIANAKIVNESGGPWEKLRVRIAVSVAYGSDLDQVCRVLMSVADDDEEVCRSPAARVRMRGFGESGIDFELLCWIDKPADRGRIKHELLIATYKALYAADIEIPYPKQDVYVKEMPAG